MTRPADIMDGATFMAESQTEDQFMRNVKAYAVAHGWGEDIRGMTTKERRDAFVPYHTHIAKKGASGFPDLVVVRLGRIVFAELKREKGGKVSVAQQKWINELLRVQAVIAMVMKRSGILAPELSAEQVFGVYIWRPSSWPEIERVLA